MELLRLLGFRNLDVIEAHGIAGADLLELDEHELREELKVAHLQVCLWPICLSSFPMCGMQPRVYGMKGFRQSRSKHKHEIHLLIFSQEQSQN